MSLTEDHEIPLELMRNRPSAVAELARALFELEVPEGQVRPASEAATDVKIKDMMTTMKFRTKSKFAAGYYAEGKAEGKVEGEITGEVKALLTVLDGRGIALSDEQRERIQGCTDLDRIQGWLKVAGTIATADELFD